MMRRIVRAILAGLTVATLVLSAQVSADALGIWPSAPWAVPSGHWVGNFIWGTPTSAGTHTGVDLWTNQDCTGNWDNGHQGTNVYSPAAGSVVYVWWLNTDGSTTSYQVNSSSIKYGISIYHPSLGRYTYYWHMANMATGTSYIMAAIVPGLNVYEGTELGWQGDATGVLNQCVHLHFTVSSSSSGDSWGSSLDPSSFIGPNLNYFDGNHVPTNATYGVDYNGQPPSLP
jgi:hypothetical protein